MKQQNFLFNKTIVTSDDQTKNEGFLVEIFIIQGRFPFSNI